MGQLHAAINIVTGEIISTKRVNQLRRRVAYNERWNIAHGCGAGRWIFVHGSDWYEKLANRTATAVLARL